MGLPVAQLEAVTHLGEVMAVPSTEPALRGVALLRGVTMPVVELAALLAERDGHEATPSVPGAVAVIVAVAGARLCIEVDEADTVVRAEPMPVPADASMPWARAVIRHEGLLVPLLDLGALAARLTETGRA